MNRTTSKQLVLLTLCCLSAFLRFLWYQIDMSQQSAACSCLWSSAESGDMLTVRQKLEEGTDPNCQDGEPLKRALQSKHRGIAFILRSYGAR
jgi:hypothetical protein